MVAVGSLILAGCGGTTNTVTSLEPQVTKSAADVCGTVGATGPGGGKIFYVDMTRPVGSQCFEAAPNTWDGGSSDPGIAWCNNTTTLITGSFGHEIGAGKGNTDNMVAGGACTSGAANSVRAYTGGGLAAGSWSLPSMDELNALYTQKTTVGGFADVAYWSSSPDGARLAWKQYFSYGGQGNVTKNGSFRVRPVRAF